MLGADVALVGGFWGNGFQFLQFWDNCLGLTGHLLSLGGWMEAWCWEVCASVSQQRWVAAVGGSFTVSGKAELETVVPRRGLQ